MLKADIGDIGGAQTDFARDILAGEASGIAVNQEDARAVAIVTTLNPGDYQGQPGDIAVDDKRINSVNSPLAIMRPGPATSIIFVSFRS